MPKTGYRSLRIPDDLVAKIEDVINKKKLGYSSISEFVKDAVRRRLEEIEEIQKKPR
ncbi:MAG: ribbon-helix-helix domain-containing protein [Candidatus Hydrothermarchaeales archaeon]